ncbi:MAG: hypothetical protein M1812_000439 [Candelaria pacifica]|nr:MAG: hypothetical protein M1812_000439 [Candelaria pacifica]
METAVGQDKSTLNKERHIKYWLRCLKTYLPHPYTSNDSNRMTLAFFIISALDLLGCLEETTTQAERQEYVDWIYRCQRPSGGFRGSPATDFGDLTSHENILWDPANLPATFFALNTLIVLGDDLERLKRREIVEWLPMLQRDNGGFGESVGEAGKIEGGTDSRFGYMAAGVRWMLRGRRGRAADGMVDIDVDKFVSCIDSSETYDGGISEAPFLEAHAGLTYCAIGALSFVDRLPPAIKKRTLGVEPTSTADVTGVTGLKSLQNTIHWLVSRQTPSVMDDDDEDADSEVVACPASDHHAHTAEVLHRISAISGESSAKDLNRTPSSEGLRWAGFNGRCNKIPDTCYSWWVGGSLQGVLVEGPADCWQLQPGAVDRKRVVREGLLGFTQTHQWLEGSSQASGPPSSRSKSYSRCQVVLKSANKDDSNLAREIHHHRQFLHPHIARLYEVIVTEKLVWLVLEYCPGDELYNYLLQNGPLPTEKVQKVFTQLVGAVSYVHNMSCVHRDLKLENILLDKHENVKLCDFGFTREYTGKTNYLQTFCGTVCYSAPEMLKGEKYAGEKVDVWSLGIILFALLTGELPFDEEDDITTKVKILNNEPQLPEHLPADAKSLISLLLSKRPLLRPSLSDILANPFLAEHAPQQQAILKLQQPAPFATKLEKDSLERMRSAGVDIDQVIENVLAQRCDALAGWWALLIEKEERKERRRERKRKEKEAEARNIRRLSAASSRLERIAPTLQEVDEEGEHGSLGVDTLAPRGRRDRRSSGYLLPPPDLPRLSEVSPPADTAESSMPPPPIEKDLVRSSSSSRQRPPLPPKEYRRSRNSTLQQLSTNPDLLSPNAYNTRRSHRRHQHPIINQLASIKHWFLDSAKRAKSPNLKTNEPMVKSSPQKQRTPNDTRRGSMTSNQNRYSGSHYTPGLQQRATFPQRPGVGTTPRNRSSGSPAPLTPHSSYRRPPSGLRGRKSTSSSVSSIRSIHHHHHSHSKASSTSSASVNSPGPKPPRSAHNSVKVLPATPTISSFPSNIRVVRSAPSYNESANFGLQSPALVFAKRKKTPFKGPMLNLSTGLANPTRAREGSLSRSASAAGRRSGEIIEEEDEDEIEEVDGFSPIAGPGEIEETIFEDCQQDGSLPALRS